MNCPKCDAPMETVQFADVEVDRCTACQGLWFDALEKEHLKQLKGSESIDTGRAGGGQKAEAARRLACPVCHTRMIAMVDLDQPHIRFESCTICHGAFFDAGEFRDYKSKTPLDLVRDWFARHRKT